ncbi:MAG: SDR family oxidoreductase [Streptosporangiales bacterium]|nr:SDR family oxidoreductase [Streptosporangiales bacterium]
MTWNLGAGLDGRVVLCTGAAGGVGRAAVEAFATTGARVVASDRGQGPLDEIVAALPGDGHLAVATDLARPDAPARLVADTVSAAGRLDVLVNYAAVLRRRTEIDDVTESDWDDQESVNLRATFFLCRAAARQMREQGDGGRIVTVASQSWWTGGHGGSVVYAATKGGVVSMTRGLARTLAPHGITVNCLAPGNVDTPMLTTGLADGVLDKQLEATPLGRLAQPEDLAGTAVFLASRHAAYITGATINVSGGLLMY